MSMDLLRTAWKAAETSPSDCLLKTQVRAKSQDDVYGLTPARCWNVKGSVSRKAKH